MAVMARLNCNSVESFPGEIKTMKLTPVVGQQDPHDEEIKKFFEATPSGNVAFTVQGDAPYKEGDQVYLSFKADDTPGAAKVISVKLNGWATQVDLETPWDGPYPRVKASFTIRNAVAAEQFQIGSTHGFVLTPVPTDA